MKNFIFVLILLSTGSFAKEPKFHYGDCVIVNKGFYKDCKGTVEDFGGIMTYGVELNCRSTGFYKDFDEDDLDPSTGCSK